MAEAGRDERATLSASIDIKEEPPASPSGNNLHEIKEEPPASPSDNHLHYMKEEPPGSPSDKSLQDLPPEAGDQQEVEPTSIHSDATAGFPLAPPTSSQSQQDPNQDASLPLTLQLPPLVQKQLTEAATGADQSASFSCDPISAECLPPPAKIRKQDPPPLIPWYCGTEYQCKVETCGEMFYSVGDLRKHIRKGHQCHPDEYVNNHGTFESKAVYMKCRLCDQSVKMNFSAVNKHFTTDHCEMTMDLYRQTFGIEALYHPLGSGVDRANGAIVNSDLGCQATAVNDCVKDMETLNGNSVVVKAERVEEESQPCVPKVEQQLHNNKNRACSSGGSVGKSKKTPRQQLKNVAAATTNAYDYSWANGCTWTCHACDGHFQTSTYNAIYKHASSLHKDKFGPMKARGLITVYDAQYKCLVCSKWITHEIKAIKKHLKCNHQMSLHDYNVKHAMHAGGWVDSASGVISNSDLGCQATAVNHCVKDMESLNGNSEVVKVERDEEESQPCFPIVEQQLHKNKNGASSSGSVRKAKKTPQQQLKNVPAATTDYSWANGCTWTCRACDGHFQTSTYNTMHRHASSFHKDKFGPMKDRGQITMYNAQYECLVCSKWITHEITAIKHHLKYNHQMSLHDYHLKHAMHAIKKGDDATTSQASRREECDATTSQASRREECDALNVVAGMSVNQRSVVIDPDEVSLEAYVKVDTKSLPYYLWKEQCERTCGVCGHMAQGLKGIRLHCSMRHDFLPEDGDPTITIKIVCHTCALCGKSVRQETKYLQEHMKKAHEMALPDYFNNYVKTA